MISLQNVTIVIPVWRDTEALLLLLEDLASFSHLDIIIAHTAHNVRQLKSSVASIWQDRPSKKIRFVEGPKSRASQMNSAACFSNRKFLWFLHADTRVGKRVIEALTAALCDSQWGRCDIRLSGSVFEFRIIEFFINQRSALTGICTGDQGIFVRRGLFKRIGFYPEQPLMEDIEISKVLRIISRPKRIRARLVTSSRRWEENGIFRTVLLMWILRLRYFFGESSAELVRRYYEPETEIEEN